MAAYHPLLFWYFNFLLFWVTDAVREKDDAILPACIAEMEAHRRQLMNDFQISPELVVKCAKDIQVCHAYLIRRGYNQVNLFLYEFSYYNHEIHF